MAKKKVDGVDEPVILENDCPAEDVTEQELSEMERLRAEAEIANNYALRTKADLENMKKRNQNIASEMYTSGKADVIKKMLPIADSFDRAASAVTEESVATDGFMKIKKLLDDALSKLGVVEIESLGAELNTDYHNALMQVDDEENSGKVVQVYEKGYTLDGKVIRHAQVVVAK